MLMHGNEPADQQFFTVYHGQKQEEDKFKKYTHFWPGSIYISTRDQTDCSTC